MNKETSFVSNQTIDYLDSIEVPIPYDSLRVRVHGDAYAEGFKKIGKIVSIDVYNNLKNKVNVDSDELNILDFGCGCGRIILYLKHLFPEMNFYGTDIDSEAIYWCQENIKDYGDFKVNNFLPPLSYNSDFFDFVYVISVFTHLPQDMENAWLSELSRVVKPGGYLLISTHGEHFWDSAPNDAKNKFFEKGFEFIKGKQTDGLPDFYHCSYHTKKYVLKEWKKYFEIIDFIPKGICNHQDLVVCQKK